MTCGYENPAFQAVSRNGKQFHIIIYGVQILKFTPKFLTPQLRGYPDSNIRSSVNSKFKILMKLILHRRFLGKGYTIGSLYIAAELGNEYFCDTLEDTDRSLTLSMSLEEIKRIRIPHETAIPTGEYKLIVNLSPAKKRMLPRLLDVPGIQRDTDPQRKYQKRFIGLYPRG
jgi:hypothetical protein